MQEVVAIDGPAGVGKSSVSKEVCKRLGFLYLDTGSLYRAIGWEMHRRGIDCGDVKSVVAALAELDISLKTADGQKQVLVNGVDVEPHIRTQLMSKYASLVASIPEVRAKLFSLQRSLGERGNVLMDGRDVGTVIFPEARYKFFLDASPETRAERRYKDLVLAGETTVTLEEVIKQTKARDNTDTNREQAPLKMAEDAFLIDTTKITLEEVIEKIVDIINHKRSKPSY